MAEQRMRLLESWNTFAQEAIPLQVAAAERRRMKMAFYAGAAYIQEAVLRDISQGNETTEADIQIMRDLNSELVEFAKRVAKGTE